MQRAAGVAGHARAGHWALDLHGLAAGDYLGRLTSRVGIFSQRIVL